MAYTVEDVLIHSLLHNMRRSVKACFDALPNGPASLSNQGQIQLVITGISMIFENCQKQFSLKERDKLLLSCSYILRDLRFVRTKSCNADGCQHYTSAVFKLHKVILMNLLSCNAHRNSVEDYMKDHMFADLRNLSQQFCKDSSYLKALHLEMKKFQILVFSVLSNAEKKQVYFEKKFDCDYSKEFWDALQCDVYSYLKIVQLHLPVSKLSQLMPFELTGNEEAALKMLKDIVNGQHQVEARTNSTESPGMIRDSVSETTSKCGFLHDDTKVLNSTKPLQSLVYQPDLKHKTKFFSAESNIISPKHSYDSSNNLRFNYTFVADNHNKIKTLSPVVLLNRLTLDEIATYSSPCKSNAQLLANPLKNFFGTRNLPAPSTDLKRPENSTKKLHSRRIEETTPDTSNHLPNIRITPLKNCECSDDFENNRLFRKNSYVECKENQIGIHSFRFYSNSHEEETRIPLSPFRKHFRKSRRKLFKNAVKVTTVSTFSFSDKTFFSQDLIDESDCSDDDDVILSMDQFKLPDFTIFLNEDINYDCNLSVSLKRL